MEYYDLIVSMLMDEGKVENVSDNDFWLLASGFLL